MAEIFHPRKAVKTTFEFTDIAGVVKGASKGEGLGNQFLGNIREVDAIVHVVRCFENNSIVHIEDTVDPIRDIEIVNLELALADLETVNNRISKVERRALTTKEREAIREFEMLKKLKKALEEGKKVRNIDILEEEKEILRNYQLLTSKPVIYVANVA